MHKIDDQLKIYTDGWRAGTEEGMKKNYKKYDKPKGNVLSLGRAKTIAELVEKVAKEMKIDGLTIADKTIVYAGHGRDENAKKTGRNPLRVDITAGYDAPNFPDNVPSFKVSSDGAIKKKNG